MCNNTAARTSNSRREKRSTHKRKHTTHSECPHRHIPRTGANGEVFSTLDTKAASTSCLNIWFSSQHVATSTLKGPISRRLLLLFGLKSPSSLTPKWTCKNWNGKLLITSCLRLRQHQDQAQSISMTRFNPFPPRGIFCDGFIYVTLQEKNMLLLIEYPSIYFPPPASRALRAAGCWGLSQLSEDEGQATPSSSQGHRGAIASKQTTIHTRNQQTVWELPADRDVQQSPCRRGGRHKKVILGWNWLKICLFFSLK